jgi:hypothetical protein
LKGCNRCSINFFVRTSAIKSYVHDIADVRTKTTLSKNKTDLVSRKFRENGYETIYVFRENEGRVSQFHETAEITKETSFAKHDNRKNEENLK